MACDPGDWRASLTDPNELWIDTRESSLQLTARNGQYWGLGQLSDASYTPTLDGCQQLADEQDYMEGRYGSWAAAQAWWAGHGWW